MQVGDGAPGGWGFVIAAPDGALVEGYGKASGNERADALAAQGAREAKADRATAGKERQRKR